ncbi:GNAT family N-acetyltransferase [Vibrio neptunius]|uniref:GNAT family N-acetyltransferase n=1 Tax=Vibrio neptunius TaxID=170651 RepID=UPI0019D2D2C3|nr:GNAT family N-acetyltransferase [Vibrio neptunius]MBN3574035.1 GNAT family N-acetyltransferase [Vibrio neptunius]
MIGVSYVCIERNESDEETGKVFAYMTLTSSEIDLGDAYVIDDCPKANRYATLPALKITRLAVDANQRGSGLGSVLVDMAIAIALDDIAPAVGCRFLIADVKTEAVDFYCKNGFSFLDTPENHKTEHPVMFIDLKTLEAL